MGDTVRFVVVVHSYEELGEVVTKRLAEYDSGPGWSVETDAEAVVYGDGTLFGWNVHVRAERVDSTHEPADP